MGLDGVRLISLVETFLAAAIQVVFRDGRSMEYPSLM